MTKNAVRFMVANDQRWLERAVLAIDNRQTSDERAVRQTKWDNNRGWNAADARIGGYIASFIRNSRNPEGQRLSGKWVSIARRMIHKYAGQLARISQEKVAA
jgi:hypothetical protein